MTPTETTVHGDALRFTVETRGRHKTTETSSNNGWRLAAVGGPEGCTFGAVLNKRKEVLRTALAPAGCSVRMPCGRVDDLCTLPEVPVPRLGTWGPLRGRGGAVKEGGHGIWNTAAHVIVANRRRNEDECRGGSAKGLPTRMRAIGVYKQSATV